MGETPPTGSNLDDRLRDYLAAEVRQAELDFPHLRRREAVLDRRPLRIPVEALGVAVVVIAVVALASRILPIGTDVGAVPPSRGAPASGSSAISMLPSPSVPPSVAPAPTASAPPSPAPSSATDVIVDCGRISATACASVIALVRAGHDAEVTGATRIVMDDTCPPPAVCDRKYPFDSIVVFVTAGGDTTGWYAFSVVGLDDDRPTTVRSWTRDIPAHVLAKLRESSPAP